MKGLWRNWILTSGVAVGLAAAPPFEAAILVQRDLFDQGSPTNAAILTPANPGSFLWVSNSMRCAALGASTNGGAGWSGLVEANVSLARWNITTEQDFGMACGWFFFQRFAVNGAGQPSGASAVIDLGYQAFFRIRPDGSWAIDNTYGVSTVTTNRLELGRWYFIGVAWHYPSPARKTILFRVATRDDITAHSWPLWWSVTNAGTGGWKHGYLDFGCNPPDPRWSDIRWAGRMSGLATYALTSWDEMTYPSDLSCPPDTRTNWWVNPLAGDDAFDGFTPATPWRSSGMIQRMLDCGGIRGSAIPWVWASNATAVPADLSPDAFVAGVHSGVIAANGDRVLFDCGTNRFPTTNEFSLHTGARGVEFTAASDTPALIDPTLAVTNWTRHDPANYPRIWRVPCADARAVLWDDGRWMHSPIGTNIDAVATAIDSTPGSFYCSGGYLYLHPFDSGDPNSIGRTYRRSAWLFRNSMQARGPAPVFDLVGADFLLRNIAAGGTTFRDPVSGACDGVYVLRTEATNNVVVIRSRLFNGGNHNLGSVHDAKDHYLTAVLDTILEQGPPWTNNASGFTVAVEHLTATSAGDRFSYWFGCNWATSSVIGSATGTNDGGYWYAHDNGGPPGWQYARIHFAKCAGTISFGAAMAATNGLMVEDSRCCRLRLGPASGIINRTRIDDSFAGTGGGRLTDCLVRFTSTPIQEVPVLGGAWFLNRCTLDGANIPNLEGRRGQSLLKFATNSAFSVSNSIIIVPQTNGTVAFAYSTGGVLPCDHNVYTLGGENIAWQHTANNPIAWTTWQADRDNQSVTGAARLDATGAPLAGSPARCVGVNQGRAQDLTGRWFAKRATAGAFEYTPPPVPVTLVPAGAAWKYLDTGTDPGTAWPGIDFNDDTWKSGPAELGYGDDDEATVVGYGPSQTSRYITTWFRRAFYAPDPALVQSLAARLLRDDGAVVYLNGAEIWRDNMPTGAVDCLTLASREVESAAETNWLTCSLSPSALVPGSNILAVEIHQNADASSDLSFNFALEATTWIESPPELRATTSGSSLSLNWPAEAAFFTLHSTTNLTPPAVWRAATNTAILSNGRWRVEVPALTNGNRFFRLQTR